MSEAAFPVDVTHASPNQRPGAGAADAIALRLKSFGPCYLCGGLQLPKLICPSRGFRCRLKAQLNVDRLPSQFAKRFYVGLLNGYLQLRYIAAARTANTQQGVQRERPSLYTLVEEMKRLTVPTLIITGDEDWPCLLPGILMKQSIPSAALAVIPNSGHAINLEEPDEYNRIVDKFLSQIESGRWPHRDPRAVSDSITGMRSGSQGQRS